MKSKIYKYFKEAWKIIIKPFYLIDNLFDSFYLAKDVPLSEIGHEKNWRQYLSAFGNKKWFEVLEIGSREVTGKSKTRCLFEKANYTGFDLYKGENVDVVGDAHQLSTYFDGKKFDIIFTYVCFEHFKYPWIVANEINKLLKVGGIVFIQTTFSYPSHERPCNYFQFSDLGLSTLFPIEMGIDCIEAGMSVPIVGRFSSLAGKPYKNKPICGLYAFSTFLGIKSKEVSDFNYGNIMLNEKYPIK
jgi:SAM-dependent methyltransferase